MKIGIRQEIRVPRFQCKSCKKTISVPNQSLQRNQQYCLEAMLPLLLAYLFHFKSYERCVWYPLDSSTLWRWMHSLCRSSSQSLKTLQRRLVESMVPLMDYAKVSTDCLNAGKARLSVMREGLNNLKHLVDLADQFLPEGELANLILSLYMHTRYPPQSLQYALF